LDANEIHLEVQGHELDSFGHVNNAVYLNYLESGRWHYFDKIGILDFMMKERIYPVVIKLNIKYIKEMRMFSKFCVKSAWTIEGPYIVSKQEIRMRQDGKEKVSARAVVKMILVSEERIVQDIPQVLYHAIAGPKQKDG